ncbi:perilipin-3 isoform X1 [Anolis carolinensis]|uniref:perilipin-3 isoform X1 n=2 Tax=Anolis carolinensis TaxID=28377 RepID=UPI002F2B83AF
MVGMYLLLTLMSSTEETAQAASLEGTGDDRLCVIKKVAELPLVSSTYEMVSATYTSAKKSHPAIQAVCDMAEVGVKAIATTAASGAQPFLDKLEPQIAAVDTLACKSLDVLQERFPVVQQTVEKVVSNAKGLLTESLAPVYTKVTEAAQESIEMASSTVRNGVHTVMETSMGQMVSNGVSEMINKSDIWIDKYLPITDSELAALAASAALEVSDMPPLIIQTKDQKYYVRLGSLSAKLRSRAYHHSLEQVQRVKQTFDMALFHLEQFMHLLRFTKQTWEYKIQQGQEKLRQMWLEWIRGQPGQSAISEPSQAEMESQALQVSQTITRQMQANCLKLLTDMEGLPDALKEKVQEAYSSLEEVQSALSNAQTFQDIPSGILSQSPEKIGKAQHAVHEVMEYVTRTPPVTWVAGPLSAGVSSGEATEQEKKAKVVV